MSSQLVYGSHSFGVGEILSLSIVKTPHRTSRGSVDYVTHQWNIEGRLIGDKSALDTSIAALAAAMKVEKQSLALYIDSALSAHTLDSTQCIGGVRITKRDSYPNGSRAEYATYRDYAITIEGDVVEAGASNIVDWQESLTFTGNGGPKKVFLLTLDSEPDEQVTNQRTTYRCTQSGTSTGLTGYLPWPAYAFPDAVLNDQLRQTESTPEVRNGSRLNWRRQWSYTFESASPLNASPNPV